MNRVSSLIAIRCIGIRGDQLAAARAFSRAFVMGLSALRTTWAAPSDGLAARRQ